jgi:DNA-binding SARP family transcriptional activator
VCLLGGLRAEREEQSIERFRNRKAGLLLAYLALYSARPLPREVIIDLFWPEADLDTGRKNLSMALSSLRRQFEPPGVPSGAVIAADRFSVQLNPAACTTDVTEFEAALDEAQRARSTTERQQALTLALELYRGPLLPGQYDDWILPERGRLAERYRQAIRDLAEHLERAGDVGRAIDLAHHAIKANPLHEDARQLADEIRRSAGRATEDRRPLAPLAPDPFPLNPQTPNPQRPAPLPAP